MKKVLAINGGKPVLKKSLPTFSQHLFDRREQSAVRRVIKSARLSDFIASAGEHFLGGREVRRFEDAFKKKFKVRAAVSFNSATTALEAAVAALKIGPGDEVIVSPYTMSASVTCVLKNGAVPVFADISKDNFCLDPDDVEKKITKQTKAVIVVNLFGGPADLNKILAVARRNNLRVIEDNAQAPGAKYKGKLTGTIGDIGVFSFNTHKIIQCGEGGVLVTNNKHYALRAQLVRNHGEVVADQMPQLTDKVIVGSNYRLTELAAAVAYEQLKKLDRLTKHRIALADYLTSKLRNVTGIDGVGVPANIKHVYYVYPLKIDERALGMTRDIFVDAMTAEGFQLSKGYVKPIYLLPIFQQQKVFNDTHFPFVSQYYSGKPNYRKGVCPVCEDMYYNTLTFTTVCQYPYGKKEVDLFMKAIHKVIDNKSELK